MKWSFTFFLFLPCLVFSQISKLSIVGTPQRSESEIVAVLDVNGRECAAVQVISDMDGFKYQANNEVVRVDDEPGKDMVFLQPDERVLEMYHTGYEPLKIILSEIGIQLRPRQVWILKVAGEKKPIEVSVVILSDPPDAEIRVDNQKAKEGQTTPLAPGKYLLEITKDLYESVKDTILVDETHTVFRFILNKQLPALLMVESEPAGAEVYLDAKLIGTTPYQGQILSGQYQLELRKNLYGNYFKLLKISGDQTVVERAVLNPNFGFLRLISIPSESGVTIDGKYVGTTPYQSDRIDVKIHRVQLSKEFYHPIDTTVAVKKGETIVSSIQLKPAFGSLVVKSEPPGMEVFLDGKRMGVTPYTNPQITSAHYELKLTGVMVREVIRNIVIRDGESTNEDIAMPIDYGTIVVEADPEVEVYIDGSRAGKGSLNKRMKAGLHKVTGQRSKYNPNEQTFTLAVGEEKKIALRPEGRYGKLSVMVTPDAARNAEIVIDGRSYGNAPKIIPELLEGNYTIRMNKNGFLPYEETVVINYKDNKSFTPRMITYAGSQQQIRNRWSRKGFLTAVGTLACAGGSIYCKIEADRSYKKYDSAITIADALQFKRITKDYDTYTVVSGAAAGVFGVWTLYNYIKKASIDVEGQPVSFYFEPRIKTVHVVVRF